MHVLRLFECYFHFPAALADGLCRLGLPRLAVGPVVVALGELRTEETLECCHRSALLPFTHLHPYEVAQQQ